MVNRRTHAVRYGHRGARALALAALIVVAACGGDDDTAPDDASPTTSEAADSPDSPDGTEFEDQSFDVDAEIWHAGFRITIEGGEFYAATGDLGLTGEADHFVSIDVDFENLGEDSATHGAETALSWGDERVIASVGSDVPTVPGGLSAGGRFVFEVDEDFEVSDATLVFGSGDERRSTVPLDPEGGETETFEPREVAVEGTLSTELLDLELTSGELRADRPVDHSQLDDEHLALTIVFDATSRNGGNWTIRAEDFALTLPSGSSIAPEGAGLESLPGSDAGIDTTDLYIRFEIDDPAAGDYTLRFTAPSWFEGETGNNEASVEFTLE